MCLINIRKHSPSVDEITRSIPTTQSQFRGSTTKEPSDLAQHGWDVVHCPLAQRPLAPLAGHTTVIDTATTDRATDRTRRRLMRLRLLLLIFL